MAEFITVECSECGEAFRASDGAKAAETGYCSPRCHERGEGL